MTISNVDNSSLNALIPNLDIGDVADPALRLSAFQYIFTELQTIVTEINSLPTANLQNLSVTTAKIADLAVTAAKLADGAVITAKLGDLAVTLAKMAANSVDSSKIVDLAVVTSKLNDLAVTTAKLAGLSVTGAKIAEGTITETKYGDGSVSTRALADGAVTRPKIASGVVGSSQLDPTLLTNFGDIAVQAEFDRRGISVLKYGADPTGVADSTAAIQAALDVGSSRIVYLPAGQYLINPVTKLKLKSNTYLKFSPGARLITNVTTSDIYSMLDVVDVENIIIENAEIVGTRTTSVPVSGGAGHGISCRNVVNLRIVGAKISNCYTDGIYVSDVTNGLIENTISDNNRRQGMSIISADNFIVRNSSFTNTNGTAPGMGIDIEPNSADEQLKGIRLENIYTANNETSGIGINYNQLNNATTVIDITIDKWLDEGSIFALTCTKYNNAISDGSTIKVIDMISKNAKFCGINIGGHKADGTAKISIIRPVVHNPNVSNGVNERSQNVAISVNSETTGYPVGTAQGNLEIIEPYISMATGRTVLRGIYIGYGESIKNVLVQNPKKIDIGDATNLSSNNSHNFIGFSGSNPINLMVTDAYRALSLLSVSNAIRNFGSAIYSEYISSLAINVNIFDFARFDVSDNITVIKQGAGGTLTLTLPAGTTFVDVSGTIITGTLATSTTGAILTFKRLKANFYKVVKEYGTWA